MWCCKTKIWKYKFLVIAAENTTFVGNICIFLAKNMLENIQHYHWEKVTLLKKKLKHAKH